MVALTGFSVTSEASANGVVFSTITLWKQEKQLIVPKLGGGCNSNIFGIFTPKLGEMIQFDKHIFQMGGSTTN